ncbi:type II toxin-antitoxin system VapC family toxin [Thermococcus camini]|uniref:Ribonuclease VapC n=1 Tax=Thermococcus camini TaxID=2016373 RepID=A0A7G2D9I9_9EURY|nr:type II toxin-antitoxin system VapC family toxin [Thermococcus camini]CAD5244658.1 Ribonuclease VapC [Thermococcus camini]
MYLVDTDVLIDVLRGVKEAKLYLTELAGEGLAVSVITISELFSGRDTKDPVKREKVLKLLRHFEVIPVDSEIAILAGEIRRDYGLHLGDAVISATAIVHGLTVVTGNIRHFERVGGLSILKPSYR